MNPQTNIIITRIKYFFIVTDQTNKHKAKYIITVRIPKLLFKKMYFFSSLNVIMSGNSLNFDNKKAKKKRLLQQKQKDI